MTHSELERRYFKWLCKSVCGDYFRERNYSLLMHRLHDTTYQYIMPMDANRAADGVNLRYRFANEKNYEYAMIASYLDNAPCSVLEMMAALAIRCEEHIMEDYNIGNRTSKWFFTMLESLGLDIMTDDQYDEQYVDYILRKFMDREYDRDGRGGLFTVPNSPRDMRGIEIWYQMFAYLDSILNR